MSALHMVHCAHMAGFPRGLISAITGKGSEIGDLLTMHPGIDCIRYDTVPSSFVLSAALCQLVFHLNSQ